jgi:putative transposase
MEYYKQGHCVYYARYHLVFATKYRRKIIKEGVKAYIEDLVKRVTEYYPEIRFHEINGEEDHMHLLVTIPPKMPVSKAVALIKSNTSRDVKKKFDFIKKVYWGTDGIWSDGYFVSTIGVNEQIIKRYIEQQGQEDSGQIISLT